MQSIKEYPSLWIAVFLIAVATVIFIYRSRTRIKESVKKDSLLWIAGVLVLVAVAVLIFWLWSQNGEESDFEKASKILLGIGGLVGISIATWRNYELRRQSDTAHKTQVSDQLTQAVDLLARVSSDGKELLPLKEARIGGLYSLESLANADPEGYGVQVMKAVVAYIRENALKTAGKMPKKTGNADTDEQRAKPLGEDVKAAFAVLKKLYDKHANTLEKRKDIGLVRFFDDSDYELRDYGIVSLLTGVRKPVRDDLDFSRANFHELDFRNVDWIERPCCDRTNFQKANLWNAKLAGAHLEEALLQGAYAFDIDMREANLWRAQLQRAKLRRAKLQGANLERTKLQKVNLEWAELQGVNLSYAGLQDTNLSKARLQGANLERTRLQGANLSEVHLEGADLRHAWLHGADLNGAELNLGAWYYVELDIDKKGSKQLWQPKSARIFCDEDFAPLTYNHPKTQCLDPDDESINWQEEWKAIIPGIDLFLEDDPLSRQHAVRGIIATYEHNFGFEYAGVPCEQGLQEAIRSLNDYATIYEQLPDEYKEWLEPSGA